MFVIDCPTHGSRVLLSERRVRALANTERGVLVVVECWCGTHVRLRTGARSAAAAPGRGATAAPGDELATAPTREVASLSR